MVGLWQLWYFIFLKIVLWPLCLTKSLLFVCVVQEVVVRVFLNVHLSDLFIEQLFEFIDIAALAGRDEETAEAVVF